MSKPNYRTGYELGGDVLNDIKSERVKPEMEQSELTYRGGYMGGVCAVLDAIAKGIPVSDIEAWAAGPLHQWRYIEPAKFIPPPAVEKS